jgi:hypothetical protein
MRISHTTWDDSTNSYLCAANRPNFDAHSNPLQFKDTMAIKDVDKWKAAMDDEMASLREHQVWKLVDLPADHTPIKCQWRYVIKQDTDNHLTRYKA